MSNIINELIHAKGTTSYEDLNETLRALDIKIAQLKSSVVESLVSTFTLNDTDLERVVQWFTEIVEVGKHLGDLDEQLGRDKQVLSSAHQDADTIVEELARCNDSVSILKSLVNIVKNLERADANDYYSASKLIKSSEAELTNLINSFEGVEDQIWIKQLRARLSDLVTDVYDKIRKEWGKVFQFDKNSLIINPHAAEVEHLVESLKNIKSFTRTWDKFLNILWQELVKPSCSQDYKVQVTLPNKFNASLKSNANTEASSKQLMLADITSADTDIQNMSALKVEDVFPEGGYFIITKKLNVPYQSGDQLFKNLTELIKTLNAVFCACDQEMKSISDTLGSKINGDLSHKYLKTLILHNCNGDIGRAEANLAEMSSFVDNLNSYNFEFPQPNVFEELEKNFSQMFQNYVREALIVKVRSLIRSNVHDTEEINYEVPNAEVSAEEISHLRKNTALYPKCVVSKSITELVRLLKEHVKNYPKDIKVYASAFCLYLSLVKVPKHESDAGEIVPLTSVLIHNNCLYLAHHAGYTFQICEAMVPELRVKANQSIAFMMRCVRSKLNELILTAMSSVEERVDRKIDITDDFLVITAELQRLNTVMIGMLPPLTWNDILATLVDHTVNEVCSKVLSWDDIAADCATELANAFSQFAVATSSLFKGDASTPREVEALTARAVKKWQRFQLLIFVLTASMKEIETKWVGGCGPLAMEFTPDEIRRLVRALFQNTDRRAAFLATIK